MIPLNRPGICSNESNANYLTQHYKNCYAYILSKAGDGLNLCYRQLYEKYGCLKVAVSPFACFQAIYPIVLNGHIPVFIDVDRNTFNLNPDELIQSSAVDAVELIHMGGNPNKMDVINNWALQSGVIIIEDCAQALGSKFNGQEIGSFGEFASFSLIKNIYSPIGGLLISKVKMETESIPVLPGYVIKYRRIKQLLESRSNSNPSNPWNIIYKSLLKTKEKNVENPANQVYRPNNKWEVRLENAISSVVQLNMVRIANVHYMMDKIDPQFYYVQQEYPGGQSNRNRLMLRMKKPMAKKAISILRDAGIAANNLTQSYLNGYQDCICNDNLLSQYYVKRLDVYESLLDSVITIPSSPFLSKKEMDYIVEKLNNLKALV